MTVALLSRDESELVDAVALRVVQLLEERDQLRRPAAMVDAKTLGRLFGVSTSTIYEHAASLGGVELGQGERRLIRFDVEKARAAWTSCAPCKRSQPEMPEPTRAPRKRRQAATRSAAKLLPVKA